MCSLFAIFDFRQNKTSDKPVESKPAEPVKETTGNKETDLDVTKEKLVKPSSFKRPRLPSGTPPKPAPRPAKKDLKKEPQEEKKEEKGEEKTERKPEEKPEVKKEEKKEEKPEVKKEDQQEKKEEEPDGKKEEKTLTEPKKEEEVEGKDEIEENVSVEEVKKKEEETKKEQTEAKEGKSSTELEEPNENVKQKLEDINADSGISKESENVDGKVENGQTHIIEKKGDNETAEAKDDLWVKRDSGKEALRPGGRSLSLKIQRSTSGTDKGPTASVRSATLPKPWSPGQAPSSMLSRKLSWEMPKAGGEDAVKGAKKERSGSTSEDPIPEDSEEQSP